jgi:uncharacterized membrane protein
MPTTLAAAGLKTVAGRDSAVGRAVDALPAVPTNLNDMERAVSAAVGAGLLCLPAGGLGGLLAKFAGGALLFRGATGHCMGYQMLGLSSSEQTGSDVGGPERPGALAGRHPVGYRATTSIPHDAGVRVEQSVTINRPPHEVYAFWRNYANLPKFQGMVERVDDLGGGRSHWVGRGPLGLTLEWDAELVNDEPGRLIAWRSVPGSELGTAGSVHFTPAGAGTEVRVNVKFDPPGGKLATAVAKLIGQDPNTQTRDDLHKLKQLLETGR